MKSGELSLITKKTVISLILLMFLLICFPVYASEQLSISLNSDIFHRGDIVSINGETSATKVSLQINDPNNNVIFVEEINVNKGEFYASFKLPANTLLGKYKVTATDSLRRISYNFEVINKSTGGGGGSSSKQIESPSVITESDISKKFEQTDKDKKIQRITITNESIEKFLKAKAEGKKTIDINLGNLDNRKNVTTNIILPKQVLENAKGLGISITTDRAVIELPESVIELLGQRTEDLSIQIQETNKSTVQEQLVGMNTEIVGEPLDINSSIVGNTTLRFPLTGIKFPDNTEERKKYLDSLSIFVIHNDGEKENIKGTIIYDTNGLPTEMVIKVKKFSTFALIKQNPIEIVLTIENDSATVNGKVVKLDTKPQLDSKTNRLLIPIRFVGEILGAKVRWKESTKTVYISDKAQEIMLTVGDTKVFINNQEKIIDCPPKIFSNRTFIPLRFISEALGAEVNYIQESNQVIIKRLESN